jgi:hypothetical protein
LRRAVTAAAQVQFLSVHAGDGFFWTEGNKRVPIEELRPAARAAVIVDCCDGETVIDRLQVSPDVVVVAASTAEQGHRLYPHDSLATFLPVVSELAWSWSGHGQEGLRTDLVWEAVERAAAAVMALRNYPGGERHKRPRLIAKQVSTGLRLN